MMTEADKRAVAHMRGGNCDEPMTPRERALKINDHDRWNDETELVDLIEAAIIAAVEEERSRSTYKPLHDCTSKPGGPIK